MMHSEEVPTNKIQTGITNLKMHHIGFLTKKLKKTEESFCAIGYVIEQESAYDSIRKVNISFLIKDNYRVELIEPVDDKSPLYPLLKRYKNSPYHFCYEVTNLQDAIVNLSNYGWRMFQEPEFAPCLNNRKVCFLMNSNAGMIELLEE